MDGGGEDFVIVGGRFISTDMEVSGVVIMKMIRSISIMFMKGVMLISLFCLTLNLSFLLPESLVVMGVMSSC